MSHVDYSSRPREVSARFVSSICLALALSIGCAPSLTRPYVEAKAAGHRAYGAGRYDEAARHFRAAAGQAEQAERFRDRDEALYLEAASYHRAGRHRQARAAYEALLAVSPAGERTGRAAYEVAQFELTHGDKARGWIMIHDFIRQRSDSGLVRHALLRYLVHLDEEQGPEKSIAYLDKGYAWFHQNDLGEAAIYQKALRLERLGRLNEARNAFVQCADKYPYPVGGLFDDALFRASLIDEKLGQPDKAVARLQKMLHVREPSTLQGSYERPRFSEAQMRIGTLYRDALGDPNRARKEFRKLYDSFTTSILRDDALWAEALIAAKQGDTDGACDAVTLLIEDFPASRYAPCGKLLCGEAPQLDQPRECRRYIARQINR